jgi:hypothetical protein
MRQLKYNEFEILMERGEIVRKTPTLRGSVMIFPHDAELNNSVSKQTKLYYELAVVEKPKAETPKTEVKTQADIDAYKEKRKELFKIARTDMKLVFQNTITNEELEILINQNKK